MKYKLQVLWLLLIVYCLQFKIVFYLPAEIYGIPGIQMNNIIDIYKDIREILIQNISGPHLNWLWPIITK